MSEARAPGRFIVLEGLDGAGTTTQTQRLVERLLAEGHRAHATFEPSSGPVGQLVRQILTHRVVGAGGAPFDPSSLALLFAADRLDHVRSVVEPRLADGVHVVSDRYLASSLAYQGVEADAQWVAEVNAQAPPADLTVFLEVPPDLALERRRQRGLWERFDDVEVQRRVDRAYRDALLLTDRIGPVVTVDGTGTVDAVASSVWAAVTKHL